jgi:hypothetical protein
MKIFVTHIDNSHFFYVIFGSLVLCIGGFLFFRLSGEFFQLLIGRKLTEIFGAQRQLAPKFLIFNNFFDRMRLYALSGIRGCVFILRNLQLSLPRVLCKYYLPFVLLLLFFLGVGSFYVLLAGGSRVLLFFSTDDSGGGGAD